MADERIRVVLDTNLLAAARWNPHSASARIIEACIEGRFQACCSEAIQREIRLIMRNVGATGAFARKVSRFLDSATLVEVSDTTSGIPYVEDPEDIKFAALAMACDADYLVTSDEHLLRLGNFGRTSVIKPSAFVREAMGG